MHTVPFLLVQATELGFNQTYPLWLLASTDAGGLQWDVSKIGEVGQLRVCLHSGSREIFHEGIRRKHWLTGAHYSI